MGHIGFSLLTPALARHHLSHGCGGTKVPKHIVDLEIHSLFPNCSEEELEEKPARLTVRGSPENTAIILDQVVEYILENRGPDSEGRAHPTITRIPVEMLKHALNIAKCLGLHTKWELYHFKFCIGLYDDLEQAETVVCKKFRQLLRDKYQGDLLALVKGIHRVELTEPLLETIDGRSVEIAIDNPLRRVSGRSVFRALSLFLGKEGKEKEFWRIRPYHLDTVSRNSWSDASIREEVLCKKIDYLLCSKYGGSLVELIKNTSMREMLEPLVEYVGNHPFEVSMHALVDRYQGKSYEMVKDYIRIRGLEDRFRGLTSLHFRKAAESTFEDPKIVAELLVRKIDQLIESKYGTLERLICNVSRDELFSPLIDIIDGHEFEIGMKTIGQKYNSSVFKALTDYISIKQLGNKFGQINPLHLSRVTSGYFQDRSRVRSQIRAKIQQLLDTKYDGDLVRLVHETDTFELTTPLLDNLNGEVVQISMHRATQLVGQGPYPLLQVYFEESGLTGDANWLRPYHLASFRLEDFRDKQIAAELTEKVGNYFLHERHRGNVLKFLSQVNFFDLTGSFTDKIGEAEIKFNLWSWFKECFDCNVYEFAKEYFRIIGRPFPYSRVCLTGAPATRLRRLSGNLNGYDMAMVRRSETRSPGAVFGMACYQAPDRSEVQRIQLSNIFDRLGDRELRVLALETQEFRSIRILREHLNVDLSASLVVERDLRVCNAMQATKRLSFLQNEEPLTKLQILWGSIEEQIPNIDQRFNLIHLDYLGHLSPNKERAIRSLFENDRLDDESVILVTLADHPLDRQRAMNRGYGSDQAEALKEILRSAAFPNYEVEELFTIQYQGGRSAQRGYPMLAMGYAIKLRA